MSLHRLLVFTDFTRASGVAAAHCYQLASLEKTEVISFHVISSTEDLEWAKQKCTEQIRSIPNYDSLVPFTPMAAAQNLFQGLHAWLPEQRVDLAFMATHGKKDVQFVTGSYALKLIFNAGVPILVVQQHTPLRPYRHVVIPVFGHLASMQFPIEVLQTIARLFRARITLLTPTSSPGNGREALDKATERFTLALKDHASSVEVKDTGQPEKKFSQAMAATAKDEGADLIALAVGARHHREEAEKQKKFFQAVITNEAGVPVLCL